MVAVNRMHFGGIPSGYIEAYGRGGFRGVVTDWRTAGRELAARTFPAPGHIQRDDAHRRAERWLAIESEARGQTRNRGRKRADGAVEVELELHALPAAHRPGRRPQPQRYRRPTAENRTRVHHVVVDAESLERVTPYVWRAEWRSSGADGSGKALYAVTEGPHGKPVAMHDLLSPGLRQCRHANGDTLDNRRENLVDGLVRSSLAARTGRQHVARTPARAPGYRRTVAVQSAHAHHVAGVLKRSRPRTHTAPAVGGYI